MQSRNRFSSHAGDHSKQLDNHWYHTVEEFKQKVKSRFPVSYGFMKNVFYAATKVLLNKPQHKIVFNKIYRTNAWGDKETHSGEGSNTLNTAVIREKLSPLLKELGVRTILDIPCGDFFWMKDILLEVDQYIGADIVRDLIAANRKKFEAAGKTFIVLDLLSDSLPTVDLILCRDCLPHFSHTNVRRALTRMKKSNSRYVLTSTYPSRNQNPDITTGSFRPLNLQIAPFSFPEPITLFNEQCIHGSSIYVDKSLGLWEIKNLPD
jgi:SAM-dependent methyltransferase